MLQPSLPFRQKTESRAELSPCRSHTAAISIMCIYLIISPALPQSPHSLTLASWNHWPNNSLHLCLCDRLYFQATILRLALNMSRPENGTKMRNHEIKVCARKNFESVISWVSNYFYTEIFRVCGITMVIKIISLPLLSNYCVQGHIGTISFNPQNHPIGDFMLWLSWQVLTYSSLLIKSRSF